MKIGMMTQWYDPETGPAALPGVFAREMTNQGHQVSVLTGFPNYPIGRLYPGYRQRLRSIETQGGITVRRVPLYPDHSASSIGRLANYGTFAVSAAVAGKGAFKDCDGVWAYNSPASVTLPLLMRTGMGRLPYFLHLQDLWPESLVNSGMIPGGKIGRAIEQIVACTVSLAENKATSVGVISPSVRDLIYKRNPKLAASKIVYVPNPTDEGIFQDLRQLPIDAQLEKPWSGKFTFMYMGAMGEAQNLDIWLDAMKRLRDDNDVALVFVGDGTARARLEHRVLTENIPNVWFHDRISKFEVPSFMATSRVQLVSLGPQEFFRYTTPSKISSILASGKPILGQIAGDGAVQITASGAGLAVAPGELNGLLIAMRSMRSWSFEQEQQAVESGLDYYQRNLSAESSARVIVENLRTA